MERLAQGLEQLALKHQQENKNKQQNIQGSIQNDQDGNKNSQNKKRRRPKKPKKPYDDNEE